MFFFLLDADWIKSRAECPSVSYRKVTARSCKYTNRHSNKFARREDETDARAVRPISWRDASREAPSRQPRCTGQ